VIFGLVLEARFIGFDPLLDVLGNFPGRFAPSAPGQNTTDPFP
jgi:hypothetical protein